jgi:hypothetical protein
MAWLEIVAYHQLTLSYSLNNVVLTAGLGITIAPTLGEVEA